MVGNWSTVKIWSLFLANTLGDLDEALCCNQLIIPTNQKQNSLGISFQETLTFLHLHIGVELM